MNEVNEFRWDVFGTVDGNPPVSPVNAGKIEMKLYDSAYSYSWMSHTILRLKRIDEYFRQHCDAILRGEDHQWKLWMATIYADRLTLDYCQCAGNAAHSLTFKRPKMLGLRFFTQLCVDGKTVQRETTYLVSGNPKMKTCRTQIEEFRDGEMIAAISVYAGGNADSKILP